MTCCIEVEFCFQFYCFRLFDLVW